jgi:2-polyprenyl-6-hydroxyphenyl methylase/3-demethylubiquinone-9 3-methyltransferase
MTTTDIPIDRDADRALKQRHRAMWASGDYPRVAAELIPELGRDIVPAAGIRAGQRVLDAAAGTGNAAIPAALTGADVVASDLTPELLAAGERRARQLGVRLEWVEADVEALPFPDGDFDVVVSVVGAMFAPRHRQTADELLRVCRPGGTLAMINWTPEGLVGQLFRTMAPYQAPPPAGAQPAPLWGSEDHVRELFGDRVTELRCERRTVAYSPSFTSADQLRDYYKANYGPTIAVFGAAAGDPDRAAALDRDFLAFWERTGPPWQAEYLLVTARKR